MAYTFKHGDRPLEGLTIQRAIGRGGFGEVYYALTDSGKQVALKYLRESPDIELRGIGHVMNLKSPHLITIYDVKRNAAGEPFVIMEYVSGPSLRDLLLAEPGGFGVQKAAFFLSGIAKGLSYLHERGIVHRDLKPANIFYDEGYVKIGDYGLSKHISVSQHSGQTVSVGTVHYMAPEIGSGSYTKAIDIYALGVVLYEMLTGRLPFSGSSMAEILMRHVRDNPDLSGVPAPFAGVIAKALAKDPDDRYQDADAMLAAVAEHGDLERDIGSFDVSTLTRVPRTTEADVDATRTSPPAGGGPCPAPALDVRDAVQRLEQRFGAAAADLPERLQRKLERLNRKLEEKAARLERKYGRRRPGVQAPAAGATGPTVNRRAQLFVLLLVTVAIAVVLGLLMGGRGRDEARVVTTALFLIGGTLGPLVVHLRFLQRMWARNTLLDRLAYASVAGLFMLPAYAMSQEEVSPDLARIIVAPMAMMVICDWSRRIERGRQGKVEGGAAFWPAMVGLVAAGIVDGDYWWFAAGVCAAISLLTQAAASMWPVSGPVAVAWVPRVPGAGDGAGLDRPPACTPPAARAAGSSIAQPAEPGLTPATETPAQTPAVVVTAAQPSFVGRTANAGMAFLGKILLLAGLVVALGQAPLLGRVQQAVGRPGVPIDPATAQLLKEGVPPGIALVPASLGSLLLVLSRRRDSAGHFVRGCLGSALLLCSAVIGILWGAKPLELMLTSRNSDILSSPDIWGPALATGLPLAVGVMVLLWPKPQRDRPIVI